MTYLVPHSPTNDIYKSKTGLLQNFQFVLKDMCKVKGLKTSCGNPDFYNQNTPARDNAIFLDESSTNEAFSSWSIVWSIGTRYKLTPLSDLMIDLRWQYYFTDLADGLDHNAPSDKFNDWGAWLNFGYIYYIN